MSDTAQQTARTERTLVVGVDGSPAAEQALRWAFVEAARHGGQIQAIAVREPDDLLPGTSFAFQPHGRKPVVDEAGAREYLRGAVHAAAEPGVTVEQTVVAGDPATELVKASGSADLLVLGPHRHGALAEVLLGSVSAECVRHARCPVVVIPAGLAG